MNRCYKCNITENETKLYSTFGKYICKKCLDKRKTGRKGHSGMIYDADVNEKDFYDQSIDKEKLYLKPIKKKQ